MRSGDTTEHAFWAIKALRDDPVPLFAAAAERELKTIETTQ
jgi:error-prone DNA polymerase